MNGLQAQLGAAFALALFGGVHCAAMCGGFVAAMRAHGAAAPRRMTFALHAGRLAGYTAVGALAGAAGAGVLVHDVLPLQIAWLVAASLCLGLVAFTLLGSSRGLRWLEPLGARAWGLLQPLAARVLPPRTVPSALAAGMLWGWIPCGMVYAALPIALVSGGALHGASVLLVFGAGTLPNLLAMDLGADALARWRLPPGARQALRALAGTTILLFAVSDLAHAARMAGAQASTLDWLASVCHAAG